MKKSLAGLRTSLGVAGAVTVASLACGSGASDGGFGSDGGQGGSSGSGPASSNGSSGVSSSASSGSATGSSGGQSSASGSGSGSGSGSRGGSSSGASGGSSTSGSSNGSSGSNSGGSSGAGSGSSSGSGGATSSSGSNGGSSSSGGSGSSGSGPCDVYGAGGTPCVAAYSTIRVLSSKYTGPLYQVRKGGTRNTFTGDQPIGTVGGTTGGTTQDIGVVAGGFADSASQDAFCGTSTCTVSKLYDQSGKGNDLTQAPAGNYTGTAHQPDYESDATKRSLTVSGHKVYALYMIAHDGYRNDKATGLATGNAAQGIYEVADGTRGGPACCWDFGNVRTNDSAGGTGTMATIFFGTGYWGKGAGSGPWFMGDFEVGVWAGGTTAGTAGAPAPSGGSATPNPNDPSMTMAYAFGVVKTSTMGSSPQYAIRTGDATSGTLSTAYDGAGPANWSLSGAVVLGVGGDNSNSSYGTFFEGAITAGRPSDTTDESVHSNVIAAGYGK